MAILFLHIDIGGWLLFLSQFVHRVVNWDPLIDQLLVEGQGCSKFIKKAALLRLPLTHLAQYALLHVYILQVILLLHRSFLRFALLQLSQCRVLEPKVPEVERLPKLDLIPKFLQLRLGIFSIISCAHKVFRFIPGTRACIPCVSGAPDLTAVLEPLDESLHVPIMRGLVVDRLPSQLLGVRVLVIIVIPEIDDVFTLTCAE